MKKTKQRNKTYSPKPIRARLGASATTENKIKDIIRTVELAALLKLPLGKADDQDMYSIQDILMWTRVSLHHRVKKLSTECLLEFKEVLDAGTEAFCNVVIRFREGKTNHYVAKAEESKAIVDAVAACCNYLKDGIETRSSQLMEEYKHMQKMKKLGPAEYRTLAGEN